MIDKKQQTQTRCVRRESIPQQDEPNLNFESSEVHPDTIKAVRDITKQYREAFKELANR